MKPGLFVVLEGLDRTGKTTQCNLLPDKVKKELEREVQLVRFPDRSTNIGKNLNSYLQGSQSLNPRVAHLMFVANRWEKADFIKTSVNDGKIVLCDRYSYSGIAYTISKNASDNLFEWCCKVEEELPEPDLIICLRPNNIESLNNREGFGNEIFESQEFQRKVLKAYEKIAQRFPTNWNWINSEQGIDAVSQEILNLISKKLLI